MSEQVDEARGQAAPHDPVLDGPAPGSTIVAPPEVDPLEEELPEEIPAWEDTVHEPEPKRSIPARFGRRIIRRPTRWLERPWTGERIVQYLTAVILVGGATWAAIKVVHPDLIFTDNTPTGGDMGAHVMGPAYLRDHLLPHWELSGWSNYWYDGFPLYRFYMVIPALMIILLNVVMPYGIAFKIIAVMGIITLPVCCWAFGRLARFRYPMPELMALAGMIFLFDESFSIYGGNVKSTMAGEFSFSIALSLGVLGLGVLARGMQDGKHRGWAAILLSLSMLSHGIVMLVVLGAALLLWFIWMDRTRLVYGATVIGGALLLSAFWVVPFLSNHAYMTDMKYGFLPDGGGTSFWDMFFPWPTFLDVLVTGFALIGFFACIVKRNLNGAWLGIVCLALVAGVYLTRDSLPIIGLLWNPRLLPFLYLFRLLLMMVGIVETADALMKLSWGEHIGARRLLTGRAVTAGFVGLVVLVCELFLFQEVPGANYVTKNGKTVYSLGIDGWDPISLTPTATDALSDGWSRYNFMGYEGRQAYGEYKALVDQMATLGKDPSMGCGRALWENNQANGNYGTTMALMLLPHWTDGCIASSEGLFFEASGTTPYHFLAAAAMSAQSSNPVRELRYKNNDAAVGVPYLQDLGIKYLMVFTDAAKKQADAQSALTLVAHSGPWNVYTVADSDLVVPLTTQPVVVDHRGGDPRERNLELGSSWFQNPDDWAAMPADDGPANWQRIHVDVDQSRVEPAPSKKVDIVVPREPIQAVSVPKVTVSNVDLGEQSMDFDVDQIGTPVLVKISYFPNWKVDGAEGPYRIAPNLMVVVPTSKHVHMYYGRVAIDYISYALTLIGIAFVVFLRFRGDVKHRTASPLGPMRDDAGLQPSAARPTTKQLPAYLSGLAYLEAHPPAPPPPGTGEDATDAIERRSDPDDLFAPVDPVLDVAVDEAVAEGPPVAEGDERGNLSPP
jgi:hypothetical protein